jgi:putative DNA methylase
MPEYRRHLPHLQPEGATLFLTWRLHGSIPEARRIALELDPRPGYRFVAADRELARVGGVRHLANPRIAGFIAYVLSAGQIERKFYELHAWVVMPNHVHVLMTPTLDVSKITRWVKGSTAREANRILGLTGTRFWQEETWDHWVRNGAEFRKIVRYIEENPVTAGLVAAAEDWPWSSAAKTSEARQDRPFGLSGF